jgi:hypothetical protein
MGKRKHRRGNKPTITGRNANTQPEVQDLRIKPWGASGMGQYTGLLRDGVDLGALEVRSVAYLGEVREYQQRQLDTQSGVSTVLHFGGRRDGKTVHWVREMFEQVAATKPNQPLIVNSDQYKRFLAAGVPAHRMHVPERIPVVDRSSLYVQTFGRAYRPGRQWMGLGPDTPIEPLGAGVSRILSRGAPQPVRYPWGG